MYIHIYKTYAACIRMCIGVHTPKRDSPFVMVVWGCYSHSPTTWSPNVTIAPLCKHYSMCAYKDMLHIICLYTWINTGIWLMQYCITWVFPLCLYAGYSTQFHQTLGWLSWLLDENRQGLLYINKQRKGTFLFSYQALFSFLGGTPFLTLIAISS